MAKSSFYGAFLKKVGGGSMVGPLAMGTTMLLGGGLKKAASSLSIYGSNTSGVVGYGKRGIDGNNMNTNGLVQGLNNRRRGR